MSDVGGFLLKVNVEQRNKSITTLLNGTHSALKHVVPIEYTISKPKLQSELLLVKYGVFVGITGDIKGKLLLVGEQNIFGSIGEVMFGTQIEGDMLFSFCGELGNMIAGNLSTNIISEGVSIDITTPSIINNNEQISGHHTGIELISTFQDIGDLHIHLLLDD